MKPGTYTSGSASCRLRYSQAVPSHLRGGLLEITHLTTPEAEQGKGHAGRLIEKICLQANADRFILLTMPQPFGDVAMSKDELSRWYIRRFGFEVLQDHPVQLLVRRWQATSSLKPRSGFIAPRTTTAMPVSLPLKTPSLLGATPTTGGSGPMT